MIKKLLNSFGVVLLLLVIGGNTLAQDDFIGKSPSTNKFGDLCYPIQAGKSVKVPITVTCNITKKFQPYTVSIDINSSFYEYYSWVTIDNNNQNVDSSKTITFNLTIKPPAIPYITPDGQYPFELSFIVYNKDNTRIDPTFTKPTFKVIVDNSAPVKPTISPSSKTSRSITISGCSSFDPLELSSSYSLANDTAGVYGMRSLTHTLKKSSDNSIVQNATLAYKDTRDFYKFSTLSPNTTYKATVTATDLAGNKNISSEITITTPPAPPASCAFTSTYCSATLTWPNSSGATGYYVYDDARNLITPTPIGANSYTKTGLSAGKAFSFYIAAVSSIGGTSELSTLFTTTTPTMPTPSISGPSIVCSSGATFTAVNLPASCSISWDRFPNLSQPSSSGNYATFASTGNGTSWVKATFDSGCGSTYSYYNVTAGSPVPGTIAIEFDAPPRRFTATIDGVATANTYKWYLDGVLKYTTPNTSVIFQRQLNNCGHVYYVDVVEENACGVSSISHAETVEDPCYYGFTIFPNPASDNITLTIGSADNASSMGNSSTGTTALASKYISTKAYTIRVLDSFGALKTTLNKSGESVTLPVGNLNNGVYIVEINDGKNVYRQQLVVKH